VSSDSRDPDVFSDEALASPSGGESD